MPIDTRSKSFKYPITQDDAKVNTTRVVFTASEAKDSALLGSVALYMPQAFTFGDGATYGTFDLGILGGKLTEFLASDKKQQFLDNEMDKMGGFLSRMMNMDFSRDDAGMAARLVPLSRNLPSLLERFLPTDNIADLINFNAKTAVNPNTNTLFKGVDIRKFSFAFKLIADSEEESVAINGIERFFRKNLYPETTIGQGSEYGYIYHFPSIFKIKFYYGEDKLVKAANGVYVSGASENQWIPKIHECFLTNMTTTFNSDGNGFHSEGQPFDVSISLEFTETKTYDRNTIETGTRAP